MLNRRELITRLRGVLAGALAATATTGLIGKMALAEHSGPTSREAVALFLAGDVMLGRGIDQILPHPGDPRLYEPSITSATTYLELAEAANGTISRPVDFSYVWCDAIAALQRAQPDARVVNLETSITKSKQPDPKGINYKMNPENIGCLTALKVDCCVLANNHVLDWGRSGLLETIKALETAHIAWAGAGPDAARAKLPAIVDLSGGGKLSIFAFGSASSGISGAWAADGDRPGVNFLNERSHRAIPDIAAQTQELRRPGNILMASIHWGDNWGYEVPDEQRQFAHRLIDDAGFDVVHGHSAHHAKGIEVYRRKLILYGCGDFLNDYEGIGGYEAFRDDLAVMYLPRCSISSGDLLELTLLPFQIRKFRLNHASSGDVAWLRDTLDRESAKFGSRVALDANNTLKVLWK